MTDDPGSRSDEKPDMNALYNKLDGIIQEYAKASLVDQGDDDPGDYVASWAIVFNYGNMNIQNNMANGYAVETMPSRNPPHATKGLLREGIDWILEAQDGAFSDDEYTG